MVTTVGQPGAAIAIDATIVRILLLPSAMSLLGRVNWWPSRLDTARPTGPAIPPQAVQTGRRGTARLCGHE